MTTRFTALRRMTVPAALFAGVLFLGACGGGEGEPLWDEDSSDTSEEQDADEPTQEPSDESLDEEQDDVEAQDVEPIEPHRVGNVSVTEHSVIYGAEDAELQVRVYEDMLCPYCKDFSDASSAAVDEWVEMDDVSVEYVVVDFLDDDSEGNFSRSGANILAVTKRLDPENWLLASRALFELQPADDSAPSDDELLAAVADAGVNVDGEFANAVAAETYYADVEETTQWASDEGVTGIPTVEVNDRPIQAGSFEEMVEQINDVIASN